MVALLNSKDPYIMLKKRLSTPPEEFLAGYHKHRPWLLSWKSRPAKRRSDLLSDVPASASYSLRWMS
jgi:hypothetical protein